MKNTPSVTDPEPWVPRQRWRGRLRVSWLSWLVLGPLGCGLLLLLGASSSTKTAAPAPLPDPATSLKAAATTCSESEAPLLLRAGDIPVLKSIQERQARLTEREHDLAQREKQLAMREADFHLVQQHIEEKLVILTTLRKEMGEVLQEQATFEEKRFEHLIKVYEVMKPAEVSSLISRLNEDTAVRLLYQMKEKKVGQILAALTPDIAARFSERLADYRQQASQPPPGKEKP